MNRFSRQPPTAAIKFLGANGTVTGSRTLIKYGNFQLLIDCGMFQGPKEIRQKNWEEVPDFEGVDAVVLTHAHVDHSGYLPKLVKEGFEGPIYASEATVDLCELILRDSAHLQVEDAKYLNRKKKTHYHPALPLYDEQDAEAAIGKLKSCPMNTWVELTKGLSFKFSRAGHILGSSVIQLSMEMGNGVRLITFSGDLGHDRQHVIKGPEAPSVTDYLVLESTYGDRCQPKVDSADELEPIIKRTLARGGVVVIPAFAVGRTQEILYLLSLLEREKRIPSVPVFVDSPMANNATNIYLRHPEELKLDLVEGHFRQPIYPHDFKAINSVDDSMLLNMSDGPMIVVSAAGMLTGGRILHHLKRRLPHPENTVIFVGYQVEETKGRLLKQGLPTIRIHKEDIMVEAEITSISSLSAHADSSELVKWVQRLPKKPKHIFLNHGEPAASKALQYRLKSELQVDVSIPQYASEHFIE